MEGLNQGYQLPARGAYSVRRVGVITTTPARTWLWPQGRQPEQSPLRRSKTATKWTRS
jgi:hypothetical protein